MLASNRTRGNGKEKEQTDAQEVPFDYEEEPLYCVSDRALEQEFFSLEIVKKSLDTILFHVL